MVKSGVLAFSSLGVATPSDLIQDKNRTPFNIGRAIELSGFHLYEAEPLAQGLVEKVSNPQVVLREVLAWTGGQPFLTQKLCKLISIGIEAAGVEELVRSCVIKNWESQDEPEHLRTIRDQILRNEERAGRLLGLHQQIVLQKEVPADDSPEQMELRLTGLIVRREGKLRIYNPIIELLVLSGCSTAVGDQQAALRFAKVELRSGVRSTLVSLGDVDDKATSLIMTEFYKPN